MLQSEQKLQAELQKKQQELMELKKQKLELAIRSTKQQMRQFIRNDPSLAAELPQIEGLTNDSPMPTQPIIVAPTVSSQFHIFNYSAHDAHTEFHINAKLIIFTECC